MQVPVALFLTLVLPSANVRATTCDACWTSEFLGTQAVMVPSTFSEAESETVCVARFGSNWRIASVQDVRTMIREGMLSPGINTAFGERAAAVDWIWVQRFTTLCTRLHLQTQLFEAGACAAYYPVICIDQVPE